MAAPIPTVVKPGTSPSVAAQLVKRPIIRDEPLPPPALLLLGDINSGNTGVDSLIEAVKFHKAPIDKLHWKRCTPARQSWDVIKAQARLTNAHSVGELQEMKAGLERHKYPAFMNLIEACANFKCDRTKKEYGDVLTWEKDRLLCLDSLSGLSEIASSHVTGHRITMTQPEFGVVQNHIWIFLNQLVSGNCYFMATAHLEYETDEVKGVTKQMASTVGKKLAPKLPRMFSDVAVAKKDPAGKYIWSTVEPNVVTKTRYLKSGQHAADFKLFMTGYEERKAEAEKEVLGQEESII